MNGVVPCREDSEMPSMLAGSVVRSDIAIQERMLDPVD